MQNKIIAHFDLDCFFVSVERLTNPSLIGKPVAVGGLATKRGVIASPSYEARKFGVRSAMATYQAIKLCPNLILVSGSHSEYSRISKLIFNRLCEFAPVVEKASIDEMYLDLTNCEKIYQNDWLGFLKKVQLSIETEFKLPSTISIASSKTVAKIATGTVKPHGIIFIKNGEEKKFLAPLKIGVIPGIGEKTEKKLISYGIKIIEDLQNTPVEILETLLGSYGKVIFEVANGVGDDEVSNFSERKSISSEETFEADISDINILQQKLFQLVEKVSSILRKKNLLANTVKLKLRFSDFSTITRMKSVELTCDDKIIYKNILSLLEANYKNQKIRLLGAGLTNLVEGSLTQESLFKEQKRLTALKTIDTLKSKFGDDLIHTGKI